MDEKEEVLNILAMVPVKIPSELIEELGEYTPYPNSIKKPCELCGQLGWFGSKQANLKRNHPEMPVYCMMCVIREAYKISQEEGRPLDDCFSPVRTVDEYPG